MSNAAPDYQPEVERNYRFNFIVNSLDGTFYWFGYSFITPLVILPLYISHFTSNPLIIGLIPFLNTAGFLLPQLFTSNFVERAPRKKFFPVNIGFFTERLPVMLLPVTAALFAVRQPTLAVVLFLVIYLWYCGGAGLIIVGWQDMVAKIIPVDRRGRFFGITQFVGSAAGILGALAVPLVLSRFPFPQGFVYSFGAAAVLIFISWVFLSLTREPIVQSSKPHVSQLEYLRSLPAVMRRDRNFLRYLVAQIVFGLGGMAGGFLIVYCAKTWNLPDSQAGGFTIALQLGQVAANLFFGFFSDRKGHKLALELGFVLSVLSFALSFLVRAPDWFYLVFFLRGATIAATMISSVSIVMEFTSPADRPTYIGLANTVPGVASSLAPLIGGLLADFTGYPFLFVLSALLSAAAFVILRWTVRDPRHLPAGPLPAGPAEPTTPAP
ncbi:MAG TPA: MFS transporter [Anaerolineaceae bacterium]